MIKIRGHAHSGIFKKITDFADFSFLQQTNSKLIWIRIFSKKPGLPTSIFYNNQIQNLFGVESFQK
jgi:hypothetical protein